MSEGPELPDWLPPQVGARARDLHNRALECGLAGEAEMIYRVASDPCMKSVWRYLQARSRDLKQGHRRTRSYAHAASDPDPGGSWPAQDFSSRPEWRQQVAMRQLFSMMVRLGRWGLPGATLPSAMEFYRDEAVALRAEAAIESQAADEADRRVQQHRPLHRVFAEALRKAAAAAEALADASKHEAHHLAPVMVTVLISRFLLEHFGARMPAQTATIASVVLNCTVTTGQARERSRGVWGAAGKKRR